jgi:nucleosome binding factor SPN SPT16 subunit
MKSAIIQQYLFGYELPDAIILLTDSGHFIFVATKKKCDFIQTAVDQLPKSSTITKITVLERNKGDNNAENYATLMEEVESCKEGVAENEKIKIGIFAKEYDGNTKTKNPIVTGWQEQIDSSNETIETVDVTSAMGYIMMVKDTAELDCMKKSSVLSNKVLKHFFIRKLEDIIEKEITETHEALAEEVDRVIAEPSKIKLNVPSDLVKSAYYPIIQSGGEYDIRLSASSSEKNMKYDIITVAFGAAYQNYCSNIARTFLIDPPKEVSKTYETLLGVQDACLVAMKPGAPFKSVYAAAVEKLNEDGRKDLIKKLPKNLGFGIGIDFRDSSMTLSPKNNAKFQVGMTFNLSIGITNIELSSKAKATIKDGSAVSTVDLGQNYFSYFYH